MNDFREIASFRFGNIEVWPAAQAEVVQPRQLPEGLLEVRLQGEARDGLFLLEVATYPERRVGTQRGLRPQPNIRILNRSKQSQQRLKLSLFSRLSPVQEMRTLCAQFDRL